LASFWGIALPRPKQEQCHRQDTYPKVDSFLSKFTDMGQRLANAGFAAILPDLFVRQGPLAQNTREAAFVVNKVKSEQVLGPRVSNQR
jgi:dienelactone hydrolase